MFFLLNRNDRSGSILQIMLYIYSFCYKHKISYEGLISDNGWWYNNNFFNYVKKYFNIENKIIDKKKLKYISFNNLLDKKINNNELLYTIFEVKNQCPYFMNKINYYFDNNFKNNFYNENIIKCKKEKNVVSIHIRRGDVSKNIKRRYTNDNVYINLIKNINKKYKNYEFHIFSEKRFNGDIDLYKKFNINFHLETENGTKNLDNVFHDLLFMINSDILICSKSSFSYFAALLNKDGIIYHNNNFWNTPLNNFIIYNDDNGEICD